MIEVDRADNIWVITLNRPDKANSLTEAMLQELTDTVRSARDVPAVVLTGKGKIFSAGADLEAARAGLATSPLWEEFSAALAALPGMTVAALNGTLAGGAFGMALACDIRISVPEARFFYPVMQLGFLPQPSDPVRMARLVGPARTKLILMGAAKLSADEALSIGLVDRVVPPEDLMQSATELVSAAVAAPPEIAKQIKAMCS